VSRLLVVEDDPDIALAVRLLLTRAGHQVAHAKDGRAGLRDAYTERPELVILDIGLPGMDGWQVLERLRDVSDVPVLLLTAHGQESDKVRGLRGGADDYLTKPFTNAELVARVEALLRRSAGASPRPDAAAPASELTATSHPAGTRPAAAVAHHGTHGRPCGRTRSGPPPGREGRRSLRALQWQLDAPTDRRQSRCSTWPPATTSTPRSRPAVTP